MTDLRMKSAASRAMMLVAGAVALLGFATVTQRAEQSAVRALESAIVAPGKLYSQPAATPVQMTTVVITTKRSS